MTINDPILTALQSKSWGYGDQDPDALSAMHHVIGDVGRRRALIHYSKVVHGISFRLPSVDGGAAFELGVPEWRDLDRAILGSFLGRLCVDSYADGGFLASALVTSKGTDEPSEGFWNLVEEIGMFRSRSPQKRLMFWMGQVRTAHAWYQSQES